jgi:hypothetical protein
VLELGVLDVLRISVGDRGKMTRDEANASDRLQGVVVTDRRSSAGHEPVGAIFTFDNAGAGERQVGAEELAFVGGELVQKAQAGCYSAIGFVVGRDPP